MTEPEPTYTERNDAHIMPWRIGAGDDGILIDSMLVATMVGNEMLSISLHVDRGALPDEDLSS